MRTSPAFVMTPQRYEKVCYRQTFHPFIIYRKAKRRSLSPAILKTTNLNKKTNGLYLVTALFDPCKRSGSRLESLEGDLATRTGGKGFTATQQELAAVGNGRSHA